MADGPLNESAATRASALRLRAHSSHAGSIKAAPVTYSPSFRLSGNVLIRLVVSSDCEAADNATTEGVTRLRD